MKKIIVCFSFFLLMLLSSCSCSKEPQTNQLDGFCEAIENGIVSVQKVEMKASITDENILVYELEKNITITSFEDSTYEGQAMISRKTLGNDFELVEDKSTEPFSGTKEQALFQFTFKEEYFKEYRIDNQQLTGVLLQNEAALALGVTDLKNQNDVSIEVTLTDDKISSLLLHYQTVSSKSASIEVTYSY